jgi:hypothetical protein
MISDAGVRGEGLTRLAAIPAGDYHAAPGERSTSCVLLSLWGGFPSSISIAPGGSGVIRYNAEVCPRCGALARIADATFQTVAGEVIAVIEAPGVRRTMLLALGAAARRAYKERKPPEDFAEEADQINPTFGTLVRKHGKSGLYLTVLLMIILAVIHSCSLHITLDVNRLIEQIQTMSPDAVISTPDPPSMEPRPDEPPP